MEELQSIYINNMQHLEIIFDSRFAFYEAWPDPVQEMSVPKHAMSIHTQEEGGNSQPYLIYPGINTVLTPQSNDSIHLFATSSLFNPPTFGSASLIFPPSTAPALKSPSTVEGKIRLKWMEGCSMERDW